MVPADYRGVVMTDRGRSYDVQDLSTVRQQKCLAHVLRSISDVVTTKTGRSRSFGKRLSGLLREAMDLPGIISPGRDCGLWSSGRATEARCELSISATVRWPMRTTGGCRTNWDGMTTVGTAALRGAVIARTMSHCSKNVAGADSFSAFTSIIRMLGLEF